MNPATLFWRVVGAMIGFMRLRGRGLPLRLCDHGVAEREWEETYPDVPKAILRRYFDCLVNGMGLRTCDRMSFAPSVLVLDVYRAIYGGRTPFCDSMECETFIGNLSTEFNRSSEELVAIWDKDLTLGKLFELLIELRSP